MRILLDVNTKFSLKFWKSIFEGLGTNINLISAYHPQVYGKIEKSNSSS
jgi:hypothetical protein